jgi:NTE family protein
MGNSTRPEEIWIIQVNPSRYKSIPETPSDVLDRRNHLGGNISLQHELEFVEILNTFLREHALSDEIRARFSLDITAPVAVRFIRMSDELLQNLDYPSKLSRQPDYIAGLIAHGEKQAKSFLAELGETERPLEQATGEVAAPMH